MEQKHQPYYHCNRTTGNTTIHDLFEEGCSRQMCWDEENRLAGFSDCHNAGFYQYDANGERTYKLTWAGPSSNRSGDRSIYYTPDEATLYASPCLVVTPQGYTKHYYAEAERITSQLGKGQFADVGTPVVSDSLVQVKLQAVTNGVDHPATLTVPASSRFSYLDTLTNQQNATSTLYFYHPDHLGSSSWITTTNGTVKQHLHYLPWGEEFVNQRSSHFDGVRYTFSAKEKDSETNLSYFGSRYYSSDLSVWLSVDPMSDKYPSLSPYVYCADNPVKLVDPNGMEAAKPPLHHQFLITVGMQVYKAAKKNGASSNGAILVLAQASLESGWGKSAMRYNDYNLFGVMGTPSKRSTTHGPVKDYSNLGGYEAAINDYFKKAKSRWPKWTDVLSQNDFTSEDIDKALNTGSYYPSKEDRQNGKYAYCGDLDENGESHYGESLIKQFSSTKKRFKDSLIYQINANEKIIQQGIPYSNEYLDRIKEENIQYKSVLDEIK